jgi:hypothetical protein
LDNSHLRGIGGWLIVILIGLFATVIAFVVQINDSMKFFEPDLWHSLTTYDSEIYHPLFGTWIIYETALNILTAFLIIFILVLMFKKSRLFPKLMIFYFISAIFFRGIDYYLGYIVLSDLSKVTDVLNTNPDINDLIRSVVQAAVWVPYFMKSKRVKVTFLNENTTIDLEKNPIDTNL